MGLQRGRRDSRVQASQRQGLWAAPLGIGATLPLDERHRDLTGRDVRRARMGEDVQCSEGGQYVSEGEQAGGVFAGGEDDEQERRIWKTCTGIGTDHSTTC